MPLQHPSCALEQLALAVFEHHTANVPEAAFGEVSGAEWWVQCKDPTSTNATTRQVRQLNVKSVGFLSLGFHSPSLSPLFHLLLFSLSTSS